MPLIPGTSKEVVSENIKELEKSNEQKQPGKERPQKQIIAIALANKRKSMGK